MTKNCGNTNCSLYNKNKELGYCNKDNIGCRGYVEENKEITCKDIVH